MSILFLEFHAPAGVMMDLTRIEVVTAAPTMTEAVAFMLAASTMTPAGCVEIQNQDRQQNSLWLLRNVRQSPQLRASLFGVSTRLLPSLLSMLEHHTRTLPWLFPRAQRLMKLLL